MIELNGIYKLKHIKGLISNDTEDYKVIAMSEDKKFVGCEKISGDNTGERFCFVTECLIDPEHPEDIYFGEIKRKD